MKNKRQMEALSDQAAEIQFPSFNSAFARFFGQLHDLVAQNFGHQSRKSFDYDESSQSFYWEHEETVGQKLPGGVAIVSVKRTFSINPRKPLLEEFARVAGEYEQFEADRRKLHTFMRDSGGEEI